MSMSSTTSTNNGAMHSNRRSNPCINWIEEAISKRHIKYYEYKNFDNIKEISTGTYGKIYRANWKNSNKYLSLKSFFVRENSTIKEIIHEVKLQRDVDFHNNVIRFYGMTILDQDNEDEQLQKYLLVMEYADGGTLQQYLSRHFNELTWNDKFSLAYQLASAVSYLHEEGIVHRDLNSTSIMIHQNAIKLADFGVSKRIKEASKRQINFGSFPYIDPKLFSNQINKNNPTKIYTLSERSDVYSVGVLLWEISSGIPPYYGIDDDNLHWKIFQGLRENPVPDTPTSYIDLYTDCWDGEPDNRPTMNQVVSRLNNIIVESYKTINDYQTDDFVINVQFKPEDEINVVVDRIVDFIFKLTNEGKEPKFRNKYVLDYINVYNISLKEIYSWLLNNQSNSTSIFLLGYFNYSGIGTKENRDYAFKLFFNASKHNHVLAQYYVGLCYKCGYGIIKNQELAFEYFKKCANKNFAAGQLNLGYMYEHGTDIKGDLKMAVEWYEKASINGNIIASYNLGLCYKNGVGVNANNKKAFELFKKSAEGEYLNGITMLGYFYRNGIGTSINNQEAFHLYQKASYLGDGTAQYNLALMYENGIGIVKDMDQGIYWYKKSSENGFQKSQDRLDELSKIRDRKD
ncbi:hypothetical protein RclHR1_04550005 [Rhizophagus clarus]|uniref:Kinase-like domain-containing protein n=1 Tax=Rhizophagus clarus TaxID=94130 RepID=A0A2Z6RHS3_9GLOM|nr:hypothetical protein RclHR1_04550005 [Rhizophagus clarus]GES90900.1 kinase-like domain-containing protein [Rhizophagus clarus]